MASVSTGSPTPDGPAKQVPHHEPASTVGQQQPVYANGHMGPPVTSSALASAPSLKDHLGALTKAVQLAQEQQSMLRAFAMNPGVPGIPIGPHTTSMKRNMDAVTYSWGDPNAQLDALLKEAVSTRLRQRAPTLRRKPAPGTPLRHANGGGAVDKGEPAAKGAIAQQKGSGDSWEVLPKAGSIQPPVENAENKTAQDSQAAGVDAGEVQEVYYYDDEDDEYALYEDGEAYDAQEGAGAVAVPEGQEQIFEEVLNLRLKLHDLDSENAVLRRQLEQQRLLMEQMQASLLLNATADAGASAPAVATNGSAIAAADNGAVEPEKSDGSTQSHSNGQGASVTATTAAADLGSGFDALAAVPRAAAAAAAQQPATSPAAAGIQQPVNLPASQLASSQAAPAQTSPAVTSFTSSNGSHNSQQAFVLAPGVDILDGLGLPTTGPRAGSATAGEAATPSTAAVSRGITNLRASAPEAFGRPGAGHSSSAPLGRPSDWVDVIKDPRAPAASSRAGSNRRASDGELAAILAVEEYEKAQQAQQQARQQPQPQQVQTSHAIPPVPAALPPPSYAAPSPPPPTTWGAPYPTHSPYPVVGPPAPTWGSGHYHAPPHAPHAVPPAHGYPAVLHGFGGQSGNAASWGPYVGAAGPHPVTQQPVSSLQYPAMPMPTPTHESPTTAARSIAGNAQLQGTAPWAGMAHAPYQPAAGSEGGAGRTSAGGARQNVTGESAGGTLQVSSSGREQQDWQCQVCTYLHTGSERLFLKCAVCNAQR